MVGKLYSPLAQPKMLLFLNALPPLDSTMEILGSRRQSRLLSSATRMKSSERFFIGQCSLLKNRCNRIVRGSAGLATSWRGGVGLAGAACSIRTVVTGAAN